MSKYQLSVDSRWGLVLGGEDSKCQSMEIGKFRCKVHLGELVLTGCGKGVGDKTGKVLWDQHCKDLILRSLRRKIPTRVTICLYFYFF